MDAKEILKKLNTQIDGAEAYTRMLYSDDKINENKYNLVNENLKNIRELLEPAN